MQGMMVHIDGEEYYSAEEAARVLDIKPATLYAYVNRGLITSYRQGIKRQRLYRRSEVDDLLQVTAVARERTPVELPLAETWADEH